MVEGGDREEQPHAEPADDPAGGKPAGAEPARGRGRALGYLAAGASIAFALVMIVVALASIGSGDDDGDGGDLAAGTVTGESRDPAHDLLPEGGAFPAPRKVDGVRTAARLAGCELRSFKVESKDHIQSPDQPVRYKSDPPTSGRHHPAPADDAAYAVAPDVRRTVHTLEHGRVVIWFDRDLPARARGALKAFYSDDPYQLLLVPDTTDMPYAVAATAWNRDPRPLGTGRLLGCDEYGDDLFTALDAFRDANRGRGPELIP
jgi:hypothetical protein